MVIVDADQNFLAIKAGGFQQFFNFSLSKQSKKEIKDAILQQSLSVYKFHISLTHDAYKVHCENLKKIIFQHMSKLTIDTFKITLPEEILPSLIQFRELLEKTRRYEKFLKKELPLRDSWKEIYLHQIKQHFNLRRDPALKDIGYLIAELEDEYRASQRFIDGDQFTLYIPKQHNPSALLQMCQQIDNYLTKNNAAKGKITDVELSLGRYLNFRQEFLIEDYNKNQWPPHTHKQADKNRILSIASGQQNMNEKRRRYAVVIEQMESPLYQFLSHYFSVEHDIHAEVVITNDDENKEITRGSERENLRKNSFFYFKANDTTVKNSPLIQKDRQKSCCILI